jgi:predicted transcriptional regulator
MKAAAETIRDKVHHLAEQLPPDATWRDVLYEAYVRAETEAGLAEAEKGDFASDDEVKSAFAEWGVRIETEVDAPVAPATR